MIYQIKLPHIKPSTLFLFLASILASVNSFAENEAEAFLVCANYSEREQKLICLEEALEAAIPQKHEEQVVSSSIEVLTEPKLAEEAVEMLPEPEKPQQDRVSEFGKKTTISVDQDGQDRLHDTIVELKKRNDLWVISLASGQVWKQDVGRRFNLRKNDEVTIFRAGFGNGFRLSTERLSGFIRVSRIK